MKDDYLTVKDLKEKIKDLPDDTKVYYQHIEDTYMWKHGWRPLKIVDYDNSYPEQNYTCYDYHHRAFCAYTQEHEGQKILILTAHY